MSAKIQSLVAPKKLLSPLKWHGGKSYLARRFVRLFPPHRVYVEPFAGGLSVLLNKRRSEVEVVGDIDPSLILFWRVMADEERFWRMRGRCVFNGYSRVTFAMAKAFIERPPWPLDVIDRSEYAAFYLMRNKMSRGALGRDFADSSRTRGKTHPDGPAPEGVNSWRNTIERLQAVHERMKRVKVIEGRYSAIVADFLSDPEALFYCDPPYLIETRTALDTYAHEATSKPRTKSAEAKARREEEDRDWHYQLLGLLKASKGHVAISGYRSALYDFELGSWNRHDFDMPNHSGQGKTKQRRVECLWMNF